MCPRTTPPDCSGPLLIFHPKKHPLGTANIPRGKYFAGCKAISAVDCLAAVVLLAVPAVVPPEDYVPRFHGPGLVAGSPPSASVRGFSSSFPSSVLASTWLARV